MLSRSSSSPEYANILTVSRLKSRFQTTAKALVVINFSSVPRIEIVDLTRTSCGLENVKHRRSDRQSSLSSTLPLGYGWKVYGVAKSSSEAIEIPPTWTCLCSPPLTDWVVHSHMSSCTDNCFAKCPKRTQPAPTTQILSISIYFRYCFR